MRRVISDLLISAGRRPGNNLSSLRNRRMPNGNKSQRRHNSNKSIEKNDPAPTKESPESTPQSTSSASTPVPPPTGSVTSSAGAATPPLPAARSSSRGIGEIIKSGPIGRFGDWYTNAQNKRPYVTQLASSLVIYLAGDLSAQLLFPSEVKQTENKDGEEGESVATVGYDPLRTLRHLTVGLVSSIPSYKWYFPLPCEVC